MFNLAQMFIRIPTAQLLSLALTIGNTMLGGSFIFRFVIFGFVQLLDLCLLQCQYLKNLFL